MPKYRSVVNMILQKVFVRIFIFLISVAVSLSLNNALADDCGYILTDDKVILREAYYNAGDNPEDYIWKAKITQGFPYVCGFVGQWLNYDCAPPVNGECADNCYYDSISGFCKHDPPSHFVRSHLWAVFDISALVADDVQVKNLGLRVYVGHGKITVNRLQYSELNPLIATAADLHDQNLKHENEYRGFSQRLPNGVWTPCSTCYFAPSDWNDHKRVIREASGDDPEEANSVIDDLQYHIDNDIPWFALEFSVEQSTEQMFAYLAEFEATPTDDYCTQARIYMKVSICEEDYDIEKNMGESELPPQTEPV